MIEKITSCALEGTESQKVEVEVNISRGAKFLLVGLPDNAVKESHYRIAAALKNIGYKIPVKEIIINLAPADLKKEGSSYDLPIAIGILSASGQILHGLFKDYIIMGELSLDGEEKQKFIRYYPNYISNVFSRVKRVIEDDADVLNEWKIYLDKIIKPEYWNFNLVIKDDSLFNNPDAEQFFGYLIDSYKANDDLKAVTLSFIYHKFNGSYIDSKESLYVEYCNDKFSGLKFTQLQQKSRFRKDEPAYDSDTAIIRRNIFNKALENWNNLYSNKQLKFY